MRKLTMNPSDDESAYNGQQEAGEEEEEEESKLVIPKSQSPEWEGSTEIVKQRNKAWGLLCSPLDWLGMLAREVSWSFVFGVIVTYGISQGFGGSLYRIAGNYFWKDVQRVQPSASQFYHGIISSVWDWKPVWGLLTDLLPFAGYHRRPYFVLSGLFSFLSLAILTAESRVHDALAVFLLTLYTLGITIADVTIDAEIAKQSREKSRIATDLQTLCSISSAVGAFIGYSTSGFIVHIIGSKMALGILSVNGILFLVVGFVLYEKIISVEQFQAKKVLIKLQKTLKSIRSTLGCEQVWKPVLYMYISWASSPNISDGKFYWYTDKSKGLGFSQEFVGMSFAVGSAGAVLGAIAYQNMLKNWSFRRIMLWAQVLVFFGGMVDLFLVLRWNVVLHVPDSLFFLFDEIVIQSVGRLKWIPQLVLCAKLCPPGIEGTFFALLMAVDNMGLLTSNWTGALLLHSLGIKRDNYSNLWLATFIRNLLRLVPLFLLFLVPNTDPSSEVIPPELSMALAPKASDEEDTIELVDK